MKFEYLTYFPFLLIGTVIFSYLYLRLEKNYFKAIYLFWFYKRSWVSRLASFLVLSGFILLLVALLDLRGPEERIKAQAPVERTIILIDTSASMLAEDIKPSRLEKAVLLAKHFARKAVGQQLSVVVFAEIQKKLVPFTNDLDLIDSRLDSIKVLKNHNGSSALTVAIQESLQYLKEAGSESGNLIVFTDGEETSADIDLKVPSSVKLAMVGIGSERGGRIPLDDGRGLRYGYKKHKGQDVITKLDEKFFKQIESKVAHSKYWIANTYHLPTDEILQYLKSENQGVLQKEQEMIIKPVMAEYLMIPAIVLLALGFLLRNFSAFATLLIFVLPFSIYAEEPKELPKVTQEALERLRNGELSSIEKIKLAEDLQNSKSLDESIKLFNEANQELQGNIPLESKINHATAQLEKGNVQEAAKAYAEVQKQLTNDAYSQKLKDVMNQNMMRHFKQEEQKKKEQQQKKDQKQSENKDQNKDQQNQNNQNNQKDQNNDNKDKQDNQNQKSDSNNDQSKDKNKDKDKNKEDENDSDQSDNDQKKESEPQNKKEEQKQRPKNISPKLKQLMSDDRQLQLKMIEQGTKDMNRRQSRESKDW